MPVAAVGLSDIFVFIRVVGLIGGLLLGDDVVEGAAEWHVVQL
jgi:hypothetical protein